MGVKFLLAEPMIAAANEVCALAFHARAPLKAIAAAIAVVTTSFRISPPPDCESPPRSIFQMLGS
jgi:hypothetical protein